MSYAQINTWWDFIEWIQGQPNLHKWYSSTEGWAFVTAVNMKRFEFRIGLDMDTINERVRQIKLINNIN